MKRMNNFIGEDDEVTATLRFRGRDMVHQELRVKAQDSHVVSTQSAVRARQRDSVSWTTLLG